MSDSPSPGSARDETIHDRLTGIAAAAGRRWPRSPCQGEARDGNLVSRQGAESPRSAVASFCLLPPWLSSPMAKPCFSAAEAGASPAFHAYPGSSQSSRNRGHHLEGEGCSQGPPAGFGAWHTTMGGWEGGVNC